MVPSFGANPESHLNKVFIFATTDEVMKLIFLPSFLGLLVASVWLSCSSKSEYATDEERQLAAQFADRGDSLQLPAFEIDVRISQAVADRLAEEPEGIIVKAYLFGQPKKTSKLVTTGMGGLFLGEPQILLEKPGVAKFGGVRISKRVFLDLEDKNFKVLVTVASTQRYSGFNILNGEVLKVSIADLLAKQTPLNVKLTTE